MYAFPCDTFGRYVRIRYAVDRSSHLSLCEVQVQGGGKANNLSYVMKNTKIYLKSFRLEHILRKAFHLVYMLEYSSIFISQGTVLNLRRCRTR